MDIFFDMLFFEKKKLKKKLVTILIMPEASLRAFFKTSSERDTLYDILAKESSYHIVKEYFQRILGGYFIKLLRTTNYLSSHLF